MNYFFLDDFNKIGFKNIEILNIKLFINDENVDIQLHQNYILSPINIYSNDDFYIINNGKRYEIAVGLISLTTQFDELYGKVNVESFGNFYTNEETTFALWAPYSKNCYVLIDNEKHLMQSKDSFNHFLTINGDLQGLEYQYLIERNGASEIINDPFAFVSSIDSIKSVVIDTSKIAKCKQFNLSVEKQKAPVIYELSVRDFTSYGKFFKNPKKFKGLIEENIHIDNYPIGLDYLKWLNITHIQLMPIFDISSINSEKEEPYNWGYDPNAYNTLEASYVVCKENHYSRINEFVEMVNTLHKYDIGVNLDVVFNHVYNYETFHLNALMPNYFYRFQNGELANGSFCGNELRSESYFLRNYFLLMCKRYIEIFNIDGLRFDLMGLIDIETIRQIKKFCLSIKPSFMLYGEGWNMGDNLDFEEKSIIENASKLEDVGFFNPYFRDEIKNILLYQNNVHVLIDKLCGSVKHFKLNQSVNYLECHDNLTLFDYFKVAGKQDNDEIKNLVKLGLSINILAKGICFLHSGMEFLRDKNQIDNTYNLGDEINALNWDLRVIHHDLASFCKDLIAIRYEYPVFLKEDVYTFIEIKENLVIYNLDNLVIYINLSDKYFDFYFDEKVSLIFDSYKKCDVDIEHLFVKEKSVYIIDKVKK